MFHRNPFLSATEQYVDAATARFGDVRADLHQVTDGEMQVTCALHLVPAPSELGLLQVNFAFDQGAANRLIFTRELAADDDANAASAAFEVADLEGRTEMFITRAFAAAAGSAEDAEELAERITGVVAAVELYGGDDADGWVDIQVRRSPRSVRFGGPPRLYTVSAGFEEVLSVRDVHARDWRAAAAADHELACELSAAVHGQRPPVDPLRSLGL